MERVATRRLIDASATLPPADRALLNLWINRGLEDSALARMTGMQPTAIAGRREGIVARLSEQLGLPPEEVGDALGAIAATARAHSQTAEPAGPVDAVSENGRLTDAVLVPGVNGGDPVAEHPKLRPRRRLGGWLSVALLAIIALVVVLTSSGGGSTRHHRTPTATTTTPTVAAVPAPPTSTTSTVAAVPAPPTSPSPSPTVSRPAIKPLAGLPGGVEHAHGSLFLAGKRKHLKLRLTVRGLPAARNGHYEVWLYNSVVDSTPLARLRKGVHHLLIRLPRHSAHFHFIDISFQPAGLIYHSGESVLRASNPARISRKQLRKRSARHRKLHRATKSKR